MFFGSTRFFTFGRPLNDAREEVSSSFAFLLYYYIPKESSLFSTLFDPFFFVVRVLVLITRHKKREIPLVLRVVSCALLRFATRCDERKRERERDFRPFSFFWFARFWDDRSSIASGAVRQRERERFNFRAILQSTSFNKLNSQTPDRRPFFRSGKYREKKDHEKKKERER